MIHLLLQILFHISSTRVFISSKTYDGVASLIENKVELDLPKPNQNSMRKTSTKKTSQPKISVCDIMKNNTSSVIKKMEFQVPVYLQLYSDLYTAYLHSFDQIFGTCYIAEKEFFDKLNIDKNTMQSFDNFSKTFNDIISSQIDTSTQLLDYYVKLRLSTIESFDKSAKVMMQIYSTMLSQFNLHFTK